MTKLTNPHTGTPRDIRDVESDPDGVLIHKNGDPLIAMTDKMTRDEVLASLSSGTRLIPWDAYRERDVPIAGESHHGAAENHVSFKRVVEYRMDLAIVRDKGTPPPQMVHIEAEKLDSAIAAVSALFDEVEALREVSERQCDNISFMLERLELSDLPAAWRTKFEKELAEDRAAILRAKGGA
jgi:hypothetical protein